MTTNLSSSISSYSAHFYPHILILNSFQSIAHFSEPGRRGEEILCKLKWKSLDVICRLSSSSSCEEMRWRGKEKAAVSLIWWNRDRNVSADLGSLTLSCHILIIYIAGLMISRRDDLMPSGRSRRISWAGDSIPLEFSILTFNNAKISVTPWGYRRRKTFINLAQKCNFSSVNGEKENHEKISLKFLQLCKMRKKSLKLYAAEWRSELNEGTWEKWRKQ